MSLGPTKVPGMSTELLPSLLLKGAFKAFSTSKAADSCRLILTAPFGGFWVCKQSAMCAPFTGQVIDKNLEKIFGSTALLCEQRVVYPVVWKLQA